MPTLEDLASRHNVSLSAVQTLQDALRRGGGRMAQFSHPELGGMGQWSAGGMIQIGDMFNTPLRARVAALCAELAAAPPVDAPANAPAGAGFGADVGAASHRDWWPAGLGWPSATGAQDGMRYACFPETRRVAIEQGGAVTVHDSGEHGISGVSQAQGAGQDLVFLSQLGRIRASDLPVVG